MSPTLWVHHCRPHQTFFLTHSVPRVSSTLQFPWTQGHCALASLLSIRELPPSSCGPLSTQQAFFSSDLWGSLPQAAQPLPSRTPSQLHLSYAWALFLLMEGRELGNHHCGTLSRHLHSDSETHFYLFTVNSYSCSQQFLGTSLSGCLVLASPLGFQDNLPRNCLSALPVLPLPFLSRNHLGLSS